MEFFRGSILFREVFEGDPLWSYNHTIFRQGQDPTFSIVGFNKHFITPKKKLYNFLTPPHPQNGDNAPLL